MIPKILAVPCFGLLAGLSLAQDAAHVVGPISDGSPPAPGQPSAKITIKSVEVLDSKTSNLGGRKITIQKVTPIELPTPVVPEKATPTPEQLAAFKERLAQRRETVQLSMGVTVFHSENYPGKVRTKFSWRSKTSGDEFEAISNINGNLLSGFAQFDASNPNSRYLLFFFAINQDVDKLTEMFESRGRIYQPPTLPELPLTEPSFVVTKGNPTADELAPMVAVHNLVRTDGESLRLAFEGRERASEEQAAFLKANPPKPKDIVLNYWRLPKTPSGDTQNGGTR